MTTTHGADQDDPSDQTPVDEITEVPDTVQGGAGDNQFSQWHIAKDLAGYLAEAVVADHFLKDDALTVWRGGNHRGVDIYADFPADMPEALRFTKKGQEIARTRVDVKHSYENDYVLDGRKQRVVSFFGSNREVQVREGVSHYALVVFDLDNEVSGDNRVEVSDGLDVRVAAAYRLKRLYLIGADDVNRIFRKKENKEGEPTGLEQCAPLDEIEAFSVAGSDHQAGA